MDRLYKGIRKFQQTYFRKEATMFKELGKGQSPDVLLFSCSDSRVDPNIITQSRPGEIFVVKNVGNIIPASDPHRKESCTAAAIEFGLLVLKVTDIVVCGHSDCGAIRALYRDSDVLEIAPNLKAWLEAARPVKEMLDRQYPDPSFAARLEMTAKENVKIQIANLKDYPLVLKSLNEGKLTIHGWYYDIASGEVHVYNNGTDKFEKITSNCRVYSPEPEEKDVCGCADEA